MLDIRSISNFAVCGGTSRPTLVRKTILISEKNSAGGGGGSIRTVG